MLPCIVYCKEKENKDIKANIRIRNKRIKSEKNNIERETTEKIKKGNIRVEELNRRRLEWKKDRKNNKTET